MADILTFGKWKDSEHAAAKHGKYPYMTPLSPHRFGSVWE